MRVKDSKKRNPYKPKRDFKAYAKFLAIAVFLLFIVDHYFWGGERPYITKMKAEYYSEQAKKEAREEAAIQALLPPEIVFPDNGKPYFEAPLGGEKEVTSKIKSLVIEKEKPAETVKKIKKTDNPKAIKPFTGKRSKIAIVIDDVGMNLTQSHAAINLDPNVTLAFLPYAKTVRSLAKQGKAKGHEIIIHTPMEAMDNNMDLGSLALKMNMSPTDFTAEFQKMTESFEGYVGINNHMGSRLTQDKQAMSQLMRLLKAKGLYFLDSKTISTSIAADMAAFYGVPFAVRDVFLDHKENSEFVAKALMNTERIARKSGSAIAIGHPKKNTMAELQKWIPTLKNRGFDLVPLSELIQKGTPVIEMVKEDKPKMKKAFKPKVQKALNFNLPE